MKPKKAKILLILKDMAEGPFNRSLLVIIKMLKETIQVVVLAKSVGDLLSEFQKRSHKFNFDSNDAQLAARCERYARQGAEKVDLIFLIGYEHSHLSQVFWIHGIPAIQFVDESPQTQDCIRVFNKYARYMGAILFSSPEAKESTHENCPDSKAVAGYLYSPDDPSRLIALLKQIAEDLGERMKVDLRDRKQILASDALDLKYAYPLLRREKKRAIAQFTNAWTTGIGLRRPWAGFHPGIYAERYQMEREDPLAHYLRAGEPAGPWSLPVIRPPFFFARRRSVLKAALQVHLFYPEMSVDLIRRIKRSRSRPDLFISVPTEEALQEAWRHFRGFTDRRVEIRVVPNRGRDIGPLLTEFAGELQSYEAIGHVHAKKSLHVGNHNFVDQWRNLLFANVIGGKKPMMDVILKDMERDLKLGLVFPDDPSIVGWTKNRDPAQALMQRMGLKVELPGKSINFPMGTMFWARTAALQPLFALKLDWSDYPEEPAPIDGTILHAIERLLPFVAAGVGYQSAVTYVSAIPLKSS